MVTDIDADALRSTEKKLLEITSDVLAVTADVTSHDDAARAAQEIEHRFGRLDVLINNAGMGSRSTFDDTSLEVFETIIRINFLGAVTMTKTMLPLIRSSKGSIVFISSVAGLKGLPGASAYSASKMVLKSFSESIRCELMRDGVHVGLIYLGFTQNDEDKRFYRGDGELTVLRPSKYNLTQRQVADALLRMVRKRQRLRVLSLFGKTVRIAYLLLPRISDLALAIGTYKSKMYKT